MTNFEGFAHPVLAVACPVCHRGPGQWCRRPSGHPASRLHVPRGAEADRVFIEQHGSEAWIENTSLKTQDQKDQGAGIWKVRPGVASEAGQAALL